MASNYTENYGLCQWEATDQVLRTEFNEDNTKVDESLRELAKKNIVLDSAVAAVSAAAGNCQMELFTYTGTGTYGEGNPTRVQFSHLPDFFVIFGGTSVLLGRGGTSQMTMIASNAFNETIINEVTNTWSGNQLIIVDGSSWRYQMNQKDAIYCVLGLRRRDLTD